MQSKFAHWVALAGMTFKRTASAFSSGHASSEGITSDKLLRLFALIANSSNWSHKSRFSSENGSI
jgi:hypothetical protein